MQNFLGLTNIPVKKIFRRIVKIRCILKLLKYSIQNLDEGKELKQVRNTRINFQKGRKGTFTEINIRDKVTYFFTKFHH